MNTAFESLFFDRNDHLREQHFTLDLMGNTPMAIKFS